MKRKLIPFLLSGTIALIVLLISQIIWIDLSRRQKQEGREAQFSESFDKALYHSVIGETITSTPPLIKFEEIDSTLNKNKQNPENIIDLEEVDDYDNLVKILDSAFLLSPLKQGEISLVYLDSLIRDRAKDMGKVSSSKLVLYDAKDIAIDSLSNPHKLSERFFSRLYFAERIIANPNYHYTVRAEYRISEQGSLRHMSIATTVSILASLIIVAVLSLLIMTLKRRHNEMVNMERSFHGTIHDLKSPLAFVYLSLSSMEEEETNTHKKMDLTLTADRIFFLSNKIKRMMQSRRNIDKIADAEKEQVYVYDILEQIETEIKTVFFEKEIQFENRIDSELAVCVLPDLFEAVLRTLIENAVKYNDNRPKVIITGMHNEKFIKIMVKDNGIGMSIQEQKRLFRPYYTSDQKDGAGIGLYYAQRIVKAHGGSISVESKTGKGSIFIINIPL